jgi:hypothetical protein
MVGHFHAPAALTTLKIAPTIHCELGYVGLRKTVGVLEKTEVSSACSSVGLYGLVSVGFKS